MIMGLVQLYKFILKIAFMLTMIGGLKNSTLLIMGKAAHAQKGMISYSKYTKLLTINPTQNTSSKDDPCGSR